ncbi:hypothetical protein K8I61_12220 [bacterium]|nr:hypothetical protein [bacterium]
MRVVKVFFLLVFAVAIGFVIHNNWDWLSAKRPIVFFTYDYDDAGDAAPVADTGDASPMEYRLQTVALPFWIYLVACLFIGGLFVAIGSLVDVMRSRRRARLARAELEDIRARYNIPTESDSRNLNYDPTGISDDV